MALETYYVGSRVRFRARFYDKETGLLVDPTTVAILIKDPLEVETRYEYGSPGVVRVSTGIYYYLKTFDRAGRWSFRSVVTGVAAEGAAEKDVDVMVSRFANP